MPVKGTSSLSDSRAFTKLLKSTKFPKSFNKKINLDKINKSVCTLFIEERVTFFLGFEDEIVSNMAVNLFLEVDNPDPKRAQLDLTGFLGELEGASFCEEVWDALLDASEQPNGIPQKLLEKKKQELKEKKAQQSREDINNDYNNNNMSNEQRLEAERLRNEALRRARAVQDQTRPRPVSPNNYGDPKKSFRSNRYYDEDNERRRSRSRSYDRYYKNDSRRIDDRYGDYYDSGRSSNRRDEEYDYYGRKIQRRADYEDSHSHRESNSRYHDDGYGHNTASSSRRYNRSRSRSRSYERSSAYRTKQDYDSDEYERSKEPSSRSKRCHEVNYERSSGSRAKHDYDSDENDRSKENIHHRRDYDEDYERSVDGKSRDVDRERSHDSIRIRSRSEDSYYKDGR